jgi:hypothetical protein
MLDFDDLLTAEQRYEIERYEEKEYFKSRYWRLKEERQDYAYLYDLQMRNAIMQMYQDGLQTTEIAKRLNQTFGTIQKYRRISLELSAKRIQLHADYQERREEEAREQRNRDAKKLQEQRRQEAVRAAQKAAKKIEQEKEREHRRVWKKLQEQYEREYRQIPEEFRHEYLTWPEYLDAENRSVSRSA